MVDSMVHSFHFNNLLLLWFFMACCADWSIKSDLRLITVEWAKAVHLSLFVYILTWLVIQYILILVHTVQFILYAISSKFIYWYTVLYLMSVFCECFKSKSNSLFVHTNMANKFWFGRSLSWFLLFKCSY